ncbi:lipase family protein [Euzebya tangerina]|uniref:lipase family protein n=1 Tax=Euzebya tangerina TaxID=591198 RepID=UPI0013C31074|nr:lipase family protein [Euzebya tangerina]
MPDKPAPTADDLHSRLDGAVADMTELTRSLLFAEISMIAYLEPEEATDPFAILGFDEVEFIDRDGAQAYLVYTDHDLVVACRGTEPGDWNDVRADANALHDLAETVGRVHRGFKREVDELWPQILDGLMGSADGPGHDVWFTGHSLGGAMAMISAGRCLMADVPIDPIQTITFGAPRVGTRRYVQHADIDVLRWVNNNDIVPRVPPTWMGYRHRGTLKYLDSNGVHRRMKRQEIAKDRWDGFVRALKRGRVDNISDHLIADYVTHLAANQR